MGKGREGRESEGRGREYRHFFLYTLSTDHNRQPRLYLAKKDNNAEILSALNKPLISQV